MLENVGIEIYVSNYDEEHFLDVSSPSNMGIIYGSIIDSMQAPISRINGNYEDKIGSHRLLLKSTYQLESVLEEIEFIEVVLILNKRTKAWDSLEKTKKYIVKKIVDEDKDGEYITFILAKYDSNTK